MPVACEVAPERVVESFWQAWRQRDKAAAVELMADHSSYALHVPEDVLPFGGVTSGMAVFA